MPTITNPLPPGMPLPEGSLTSNDDLGPHIIAASWGLTSLAAVFVFTRIFAKLWTRRGLWFDDYVLIIAWLAVLAAAVASTVAVSKGLGKHVFNVPSENVEFLSILINVSVSVLILASALSKTSFVMTVLRLVSGYLRWAAWFILVSTNVLLGINIILLWVSFEPNRPTAGPPSPSDVSFETSLSAYGIFITAYSAAMDFALVGMAWFIVSRLHMRSTREKVGVGIALSMGMIAGAASIVKADIFPTLMNGDISYTSASLHIWSIAEPSITIVAASSPLIRVLFAHVAALTTRSRATRTSGSGGLGGSAGPSYIVSGSHRKGSVVSFQASSVQTGRGGPYDDHHGNLSAIKGSEEDLILKSLRGASRVRRDDDEEMKDVGACEPEGRMARGGAQDTEPRRTSSDGGQSEVAGEPKSVSKRTTVGYGFGPASLYETRLAQKYATGHTTPEPGIAL